MAIPTPGKGVKVGSAYVDIVPKLDRLTNSKVLAEVNKELQKAYTPNYDQLNADQKRNQEIQARTAQQTTAAILKNRLAAEKEAQKASVAGEKAASDARTKVARAETQAYQEEYRRRSTLQKQISRDYDSAVRDSRKLEADAARDRDNQNTKSEGILHKLATQFRTIGTLARGLSVVSVGFLGFQALEKSIGAIQAALPVVTAGLVALPGIVAAVGAEALILHVAFKNIGTAIKDGFDPTKVKQFNQEMQKLSPSARSFVKDILQLKGLKLPNLQEQLFGNAKLQSAGKQIGSTAQKIAPSTAGVASASGGVLGTLLGGLETKSAVQNIKDLFNGMAAGLRNVTPGLGALEAGLLHLIGSDGLFGGKAGTSIGKFFTTVGDGLKKVNVAQVFHAGYVALQGFWGIAKNVAGTIGGIVRALGTAGSGAGFLGSITAITKEFNRFANSASGQKFLTQLFKSLNDIAHLIDTVVADALKFLALAFAGLEPTIHALVNTLKRMFDDLVPLGPVVGTMAKAALGLANVLLTLLEPALRLVVDLLAKIPKPVLEGIAVGLIAIFGAVKLVAAVTKAWVAIQLALDAALDANPIGLVIIALAALAAGIVYVATKTKFFQTVWHGMEVAFKAVLKFLTTGFTQFGVLILGPVGLMIFLALHWKQTWATIRAVFDDAWHFLRSVGTAIGNFFTKTLPGWIDSGKNHIISIIDSLRARLASFWKNDILGTLSHIRDFFTKTIPGWFDSGKNHVISIIDSIRNRVKTFVNTDIIGTFTKLKNFITQTVPGWFGLLTRDVIAGIKVLVQGIKAIWSTITKIFADPIKAVVGPIFGGLEKAWNAVDGAIGGKHKINLGVIKIPYAAGGYVNQGFGGPTQDNVFLPGHTTHPGIRVSGGEYVVKANVVAKPGVLDFLNTLNNQNPNIYVGGDPSAAKVTPHPFASGGSVPAAARARVPATLQFLHNIAASGIPYVLGANGPRAYDCSSLVGNVWARLTGNQINRRYFVTQTEAPWLLGHGFAPGGDPSGFNVGLTSPPEHTVGMLGGHRFEAAHTGTTMRFDGAAANALRFARVFHMIGMSGVGGSFGIPAVLQAVSTAAKFASHFGAIFNKVKFPNTGYTPEAKLVGPAAAQNLNTFSRPLIQKAIQAAQAAASSGFGAGAALGNVGSGQIAKWIAQASKFANIPASWVPGIETIIKRESGGNPNAVNRTDSNAKAGHPSQGLMQTIPSTFHRYHAAGTSNNILDPVANIAAAVNYIHARYGDISRVQQANPNRPPHGYSVGGPVLTRDRGGVIPQGLSSVFNGTGKPEYAFTSDQLEMLRHDCHTTVIVDGVDVTSKAHVVKNNKELAIALGRK